MIAPGEIVLHWDAHGQLSINAPLGDKLLCCRMLCEAQWAILSHFPGLVLPNGTPPPDLHSRN